MIENYIDTNGQKICYQTFGESQHTPILLIQGSGAQSILWPDRFCQALSHANLYVIRYDHRDTGKSSYVDFEVSPYNLMDLTKDAVGILDALNISQAHIVGSSMGGYIAQLFGIYFPNKVLSLTLMMTSPASVSLEHAFLEQDENPFTLPLPTEAFTDAILDASHLDKKSDEALANQLVKIWAAYNGNGAPIDTKAWFDVAIRWKKRSSCSTQNLNHRLAIDASPISRESLLSQISIPTLILHGGVDPFFMPEHAYALESAIHNAKLMIIDNMGHLFHEAFIEPVREHLLSHLNLTIDDSIPCSL